MEKLSRIVGLRLLAIKEGAECGKVREVVIDQNKKCVRFFVLDTGKGCFGLQSIAIDAVSGIGKDFCTTLTQDSIVELWKNEEAMQLAFSDTDLINARVVSNMGDVIGNIADFEFDAKTGDITSYIMEDGQQLERQTVVTLARGIVFVDAEGGSEGAYAYEEEESEDPEPVAEEEIAPEPEPVAEPEMPVIEEEEPLEEMPEPIPEEIETVAEPEVELEAPAPEVEEAPEEPALPTAEEAAEAPESAESEENPGDMKAYFEKRRMQFLVGRTLKQDVVSSDGETLASAGDTVDDALIELVRVHDKLNELIMSVN